jgi:glutamate 5-kinase
VVKVGTSNLTDRSGRIDRGYIADLTAQLAAQRAAGGDVVLVTSGAIRAGRERLLADGGRAGGTARSPELLARLQDTLPYKQAAAAVGQGLLIQHYTEAFAWRGVDCAQILLTREDLGDRKRFLNARNTLLALLSLGVVPIINENDTVAIDEIKFGDNDTLAAHVAGLVDASLLLILSDVDGLYDGAPGEDQSDDGDRTFGPLIPLVMRVDSTVQALATGAISGVGTGGMATKVEAARIATAMGIRTVIAHGRRPGVVADAVSGAAVGTTFLARSRPGRLPARKRWIAHGARSRGSVTVNRCARERLEREGASLLAVGIVGVNGSFASGDLIEVRDESGQVFARGLTNYACGEIERVRGLHSEQLEEALGYRGFDEVIHRDNLVVHQSQSAPAAEQAPDRLAT